jgi:hypothetical protein
MGALAVGIWVLTEDGAALLRPNGPPVTEAAFEWGAGGATRAGVRARERVVAHGAPARERVWCVSVASLQCSACAP